jgi:hypothetical protein
VGGAPSSPTLTGEELSAISSDELDVMMKALEKFEMGLGNGKLDDFCLLEEQDPSEQLLAPVSEAPEKIKVTVAMDSGAAKNVVHPDDLPRGVFTTPNSTGRHFVGPAGETIVKHGTCVTAMEGPHGKLGCNWSVADVTRTLNAVSQTTGPAEHETGHHDVLFNNKRCVVVPPGIVERIMKSVKPTAEYKRQGGLYLADVELTCMPESSFIRPGMKQ